VDVLTGPKAEKLCLELAYAATEAEVIAALKPRDLWNREAWVARGEQVL
jgi:hypothetical protein